MRPRLNPVEALVTLPRLTDPAKRRSSWRQVITLLGQHLRVTGPPPLDGVEPDELVLAARAALETGLCDDLDWLAPGRAAAALYELTSALPPGRERLEYGRRVFARLYEGTAHTFAAVATRMALGPSRPLDAAPTRARLALVFDLPIGTGVNADALALNFVGRPQLRDKWVDRPSMGALPARRLAAKLLEHAAREAMHRALQGDPYPAALLFGDSVRPAFWRLLNDREPLVWRHAAIARGLLSAVDAEQRAQIENALDPSLSPTEWRRAAVSLTAATVGDPDGGLQQCRGLLESDIARRDPGVVATMVWGLPPVIEAEPDAALELLERLCATGRADVGEAAAILLADLASWDFGARAAPPVRAALLTTGTGGNPARRVLTDQALGLLDRDGEAEPPIQARVREAMGSYERTGARAAHETAARALEAAYQTMDRLARLGGEDEATLAEVVSRLSDLDVCLLERSRLADLLLLNRRAGDTDTTVSQMDRIYDRVGGWLLDAESAPEDEDAEWTALGAVMRQRRLRALLHLVDLDTSGRSEDEEATARVRARIRRAVTVLVDKLASNPDGSLHRILCATLARSLDAAVREGVADPADLWLLLADSLTEADTLAAITEGSTTPEMQCAAGAYSAFLASNDAAEDTDLPPSQMLPDAVRVARRVVELSRRLGAGGSHRSEALRQVVLRTGRALEAVATIRGQAELIDVSAAGSDPASELEIGTDALRTLLRGARRRVLKQERRSRGPTPDALSLSALVEGAVSGMAVTGEQINLAIRKITSDLPLPVAGAIWEVTGRIHTLPVAPGSDVFAIPLEKRRATLPDWLLPRRTIGAFYVVRALGTGGVSSVFVARRIEERNDSRAEAFALKVPQYDPTTARSLSEQEFMQMFRDEAGALLSLPPHANLARFVTFDLAARPRPILVMELIRGMGLDRLIRSRSLTMDRALHFLDGVLAGLEAMHGVGVGHLDVKPSNVIVRDDETPVLVDFGLSGRHLRPGCGTLEYCAPEVLGVVPEGHSPRIAAADVYSFATTAFELLTTELLFDATDETALMAQQVSHDGWPPKLAAWTGTPALSELSVILAACLRRDGRDRPTATATRRALAKTKARLQSFPWPVSIRAETAAG